MHGFCRNFQHYTGFVYYLFFSFQWVLSFLYVYSDHSILECYNLFSGVELSMRLFFVISYKMLYNTRYLLACVPDYYPFSGMGSSLEHRLDIYPENFEQRRLDKTILRHFPYNLCVRSRWAPSFKMAEGTMKALAKIGCHQPLG